MTDVQDKGEAGGLPARVQPRKQAVADARLAGELSLAGMDRLAAYLLPAEDYNAGRARVELHFFEDPQRRVTIEGRLQADLRLQCQTCLAPVDWHVDQALALMVALDEGQAADVPRSHDPLEVDGEDLELARLVEDELILALPLVARCGGTYCRNRPQALDEGEPEQSPFAVLRELKSDDE